MNNTENAFNIIYPPALRLGALKKRFDNASKMNHEEEMDSVGDEIIKAVEDVVEAIDTIESGMFDDSLSCSMAGVLNRVKRRSQHN